MKRKNTFLIILLSMVLLLPIVSAPRSAKGDGASSIMFGDKNWLTSYEEGIVADETCDMIMYMFNDNDAFYYLWNAYGDYTLPSYVYSSASYCENNFDWCTVFYTGHGLFTESSPHNYWIYSNQEPLLIYDTGIYNNTYSGKHYFTFLWACGQANEIGSGSPVHGMPYCWTHNSGMSTDGWDDPDSGDYCFIGFQYASRGLCEYDPIGWANYGEFVSWFYYYALYYHFSINDAINAAASAILVDGGFTNCELYYGYEVEGFSCRMRIIGNGNLELPY